jgi:hypothetical protein
MLAKETNVLVYFLRNIPRMRHCRCLPNASRLTVINRPQTTFGADDFAGSNTLVNKLKLQLSRYTPRRRLGERIYSIYSLSTSALDGGEWSASSPGRALAPGKGPPVPIGQEAGLTPEPVWTQRLEEKSFHHCRGSNLDRPVVQPVARHYTDWATRLTLNNDNVTCSQNQYT